MVQVLHLFTRLVEVLTNGYLQDGMPKTMATHLKYVSLVATGRDTGIMPFFCVAGRAEVACSQAALP